MPVSSGDHVQFMYFQLYTTQLMFTLPGFSVNQSKKSTQPPTLIEVENKYVAKA